MKPRRIEITTAAPAAAGGSEDKQIEDSRRVA
jgi:hypothetical protein